MFQKTQDSAKAELPRMLMCAVISVVLVVIALYLQTVAPGNIVSVSFYKMHLMCLAGWGGYWLDRALFPYDRPHEYLADEVDQVDVADIPPNDLFHESVMVGGGDAYCFAMIRRAIIVAACLLCVGLGA